MFLITQFIGIYVVDSYSSVKLVDGEIFQVDSPNLPFGLESPELEDEEFNYAFASIIFAFIIAISLLFFLSKFKIEFFIKLWFFLVVMIALIISFNIFLIKIFPQDVNFISLFPMSWFIAFLIALPFSIMKIYKRDFFIHNLTELFIYPGIAAVFVPILNIYTISLLLIIISVYDIWAVWYSGIMQKMAQYQIKKLNIFSGFFVPHISKSMKQKLRKMKPSQLKKKKISVSVAVLGGGDVIFPIIAAGVMLKTLGLMSAIFVVLGAALGLSYLLFFSEKKKFYPAMPFITAGIFIGIFISYLIL